MEKIAVFLLSIGVTKSSSHMDTVVDNLELLKILAHGDSKEWGLETHPGSHPLMLGLFTCAGD